MKAGDENGGHANIENAKALLKGKGTQRRRRKTCRFQ